MLSHHWVFFNVFAPNVSIWISKRVVCFLGFEEEKGSSQALVSLPARPVCSQSACRNRGCVNPYQGSVWSGFLFSLCFWGCFLDRLICGNCEGISLLSPCYLADTERVFSLFSKSKNKIWRLTGLWYKPGLVFWGWAIRESGGQEMPPKNESAGPQGHQIQQMKI